MSQLPVELQGRWNHNTHYYPLALEHTPCERAVDVGCGDGLLLSLLSRRCTDVIGVDPSAAMVELARATCTDRRNVSVRQAELLRCPLPDESFDLVTCYAALHHMPVDLGLRRMADLVRPGGWLVVVGLGQNTTLGDLAADTAGFFLHRALSRRYGTWKHPAPVIEPTLSHQETRRVAAKLLPDAQWRRHALFRHSIRWQRPAQ